MRPVTLAVELAAPPNGRLDTAAQALKRINRLKDNLKCRENTRSQGTIATLRAERSRLFRERAELRELTLAQARGALQTVDEFEHRMSSRILDTRHNLLNLPRRIAHQIEGRDASAVEIILGDALRTALAALSK